MDGNISEMLKGVLSDPDAMKKLMGAAEALMGGNGSQAPTETEASVSSSKPLEREEETEGNPHPKPECRAGNNERIALIAALRPYLSPERRQTADSLIKMLKMLKLADLNKLLKE